LTQHDLDVATCCARVVHDCSVSPPSAIPGNEFKFRAEPAWKTE